MCDEIMHKRDICSEASYFFVNAARRLAVLGHAGRIEGAEGCHGDAVAGPKSGVMILPTRPAMPKKAENMTFGERELEAARQQILRRMHKPPSERALSQLRQELRAIDIELDNVRRIFVLCDAPPVAPIHVGMAG
jgi:hypothetical protein